MFVLRDYQDESVELAIQHILKCCDPGLLSLATGAGKSLIVAFIAKFIAEKSGKKILCLAPSTELVLQNREKYLELGEPASIYSAGAGGKCIKHSVVFGSPKTVANNLNIFNDRFALVIIDEAHGITPTLIEIIESMKVSNPKLRVLGLTATPYRMNTGYIYQMDKQGKPMGDDRAINPFFKRLIHEVPAELLIARGYLTPPTTSVITESYDTSELVTNSKGEFTADSLAEVFNDQERLTHEIVNQVISSSNKCLGVMFFAATIQHADEIMRSLPKGDSEIVTGKTKKKDRADIIKRFKEQKFKYLVNVSVLTTGFDAPHVDLIAILRPTESASLFQQIMGRGARLYPGKATFAIMDFANNIENHGLEDNLFKPEIKVNIRSGEKFRIQAVCKTCGFTNDFGGRPNKEEFKVSDDGYFIDLMGELIIDEETKKPYPAHFGRRCESETLIEGNFERCPGRWSFKKCLDKECNQENDIAAKYCCKCRMELIDPNDKLRIDFKKIKKSPYEPTSDRVLSFFSQHHVAKNGAVKLKVDWKTEYRSFDVYYSPEKQYLWTPLCRAIFGRVMPTIDEFVHCMQQGLGKVPKTITSSKKKGARFVNVFDYNQDEDIES